MCSRGAFRVPLCPSCIVRRHQFLQTSCFPPPPNKPLGQCGLNWQVCTFGVLFKNCSQNLIPSKTLAAMAAKMKLFLILFLLWNCWSDFEKKKNHKNVPCVTLFKIFLRNFDPHHRSSEWGPFAIYGHEEILKKSCPLKRQVKF